MFTAEELSVVKAMAEYSFPLHARPPIVQGIIDKAGAERARLRATREEED